MKGCAGGILVREGRILLGRRAANREFYPDVWDIIGGHCRSGEEPDQTLARELQEEIGLTPTAFTKLGVLMDPHPDIHGQLEYHIYAVIAWAGSGPVLRGEEHSELRWFPVREAIRLDLAHPGYPALFEALAD